MPSSHTMNSLVLNGYAAYFLLQHGFVEASAAPWLYSAAAAWTLWIGLARIYLGLHTCALTLIPVPYFRRRIQS